MADKRRKVAQLDRFVKEFGEAQGAKYYADGLSYAEAIDAERARLQAENTELRRRCEQAEIGLPGDQVDGLTFRNSAAIQKARDAGHTDGRRAIESHEGAPVDVEGGCRLPDGPSTAQGESEAARGAYRDAWCEAAQQAALERVQDDWKPWETLLRISDWANAGVLE